MKAARGFVFAAPRSTGPWIFALGQISFESR
jgi:hypothetical protein